MRNVNLILVHLYNSVLDTFLEVLMFHAIFINILNKNITLIKIQYTILYFIEFCLKIEKY